MPASPVRKIAGYERAELVLRRDLLIAFETALIASCRRCRVTFGQQPVSVADASQGGGRPGPMRLEGIRSPPEGADDR